MLPFTGTPQAWNELIASLPISHLLQTWEWSQVKSKYGWKALPFVWYDHPGKGSGLSQGPAFAAAMILKRSIPVGGFARKMCVLYVPKGPLMDWNDASRRQRVLERPAGLRQSSGRNLRESGPGCGSGDRHPRNTRGGRKSEADKRSGPN